MRAVPGTLLSCDPAAKQLILSIDERLHFVIQDLDESHLLVSTHMVEEMREHLEAELEKNSWSMEQ